VQSPHDVSDKHLAAAGFFTATKCAEYPARGHVSATKYEFMTLASAAVLLRLNSNCVADNMRLT